MTDKGVVRIVVVFLGAAALLLSAGNLWLFREVLIRSTGRESIDPAVVAMFGTVATLAGTVLGALGAMLVSTRSSTSNGNGAAPLEPEQVAALITAQLQPVLEPTPPDKPPPIPVEVVGEPLQVEPVPAGGPELGTLPDEVPAAA